MASSLTVRLTQTDPDSNRNIALEPFVDGLYAVLGGWHTVTNIKTFYNMTPEDQTAFDTLVSKVNSAADLQSKMLRIQRVRGILALWEQQIGTGYDTVDDIETHLTAIDAGTF